MSDYHPRVKLYVLPGGTEPERKTENSVGYDVCVRAIVSPTEMDADRPYLRKTVFDFFDMPADPAASHVIRVPAWDGGERDEFAYRLDPGESVFVGIGFITEMPYPMFYWVLPRIGLPHHIGIQVLDAPSKIDSDYRGEAGLLIYNGRQTPFILRRGMGIAQIIFQWAIVPELARAASSEELTTTSRGAGGYGSTGFEVVSVKFPDKEWTAEVVARSDTEAIDAIKNDPATPPDPQEFTIVDRVGLGKVLRWFPHKRHPVK